eukprot:357480-Chlamydomonas_euryale.AAC.2
MRACGAACEQLRLNKAACHPARRCACRGAHLRMRACGAGCEWLGAKTAPQPAWIGMDTQTSGAWFDPVQGAVTSTAVGAAAADRSQRGCRDEAVGTAVAGFGCGRGLAVGFESTAQLAARAPLLCDIGIHPSRKAGALFESPHFVTSLPAAAVGMGAETCARQQDVPSSRPRYDSS